MTSQGAFRAALQLSEISGPWRWWHASSRSCEALPREQRALDLLDVQDVLRSCSWFLTFNHLFGSQACTALPGASLGALAPDARRKSSVHDAAES